MKYKLKEIFDLHMGKTPSRNNAEYWNSNEYKWISIADLSKTGKYIRDTKEHLSKQAIDESGIKLIPANTVIMSFKLSIGKTAITAEDMYSNEAIMAFHDKHVVDILPEYLFYMFKFKNWDEGSNKAVMGKTLNKATLSDVEIDVCSIEKQREIVDILNKIMNILENRDNEIVLLDNLIKARFVEMFGNARENPKGYKMVLFNDIVEYMGDIGSNGANKGMSSFISDLILENKGTFENKRSCDMNAYGVYGKTVQRTLFEGDEKKRYIHIYHSISKDADEREHFENALRERTALLMSHQNETVEFGSAYEKYFYLHYDKDGVFLYPEEKTTVTEREISLCGYFVIITSERMTAKEALHLYKSRDVSEKFFASDKSFLGNKSMRSHTNEGVEGRIFTQFIALIIRNKIYTALQEENEKLEKKQNYMTVPAAVGELEKIEMTRQTDNVYRLDHAVTAKQKKILKAFGMNEGNITYRAGEISNTLKKSNIQKERR